MTITDIRRGKGEKYHLYVDGEYLLTIHGEVLFSQKLRINQPVEPEDLEFFKQLSEERFAKEKALSLLSSRSYTAKQLEDKLAQTVERETAEQVVSRMEELGLINDEDYAQRLARDLSRLKKFGSDRIRQELCRRGIDREIAEEVLEDLEEDPRTVIAELCQRKFYTQLLDPSGKGPAKAVHALIRMGYRYDDIRPVIREFLENEED